VDADSWFFMAMVFPPIASDRGPSAHEQSFSLFVFHLQMDDPKIPADSRDKPIDPCGAFSIDIAERCGENISVGTITNPNLTL